MSRKNDRFPPEATAAASLEVTDYTAERLAGFAPLLDNLRTEQIVADLCELIAIPSVNPFDDEPAPGQREAEVAAWYGARLEELGLAVSMHEVVPGRPNLWGVLEGAAPGPALVLAGHLDTVGVDNYPDGLEPRVEDARVYGRGACDMKGALACFLEVARVIREHDVELHGDLVIVGTADEEWQLIGSQGLQAQGLRADFGIVGEPTELTVCPSHKGEVALAIRTFGKAAHASVPERGHNAIDDMGLVLGEFSDLDETLRQRDAHRFCGHGRFSVGTIRGGSMVATVPDFCEIEVDRRTLPGEDRDSVIAEYRARLDKLARGRNDFVYELSDPLIDIGPLETPLDAPVVRATVAAFQSITGEPARVQAFPAGTDAPNLGFPALIFGPGSVEQAHSLNEYVAIEQLETAARVYLATALALLTKA